jgi:hypothetical protein
MMKVLLTFLVWVESKTSVELLMALLFHDSLTEDGILMDDIHWLLLLLLFGGCCHAASVLVSSFLCVVNIKLRIYSNYQLKKFVYLEQKCKLL